MQKLLVVAAVVVAALLARPAQALGVGADVGYSRILNGDGLNGFGADAYVRPPVPIPLVDLEFQAGYHHFSDNGATLSFVPFMVGARLNLPIPAVKLFVGAHVGGVYQSAAFTLGSTNLSLAGSTTDFAFNVGGGLIFLDLPLVKLGLAAWYYQVSDQPDTKLLSVGLNADVGL